MKTNGPSLSRLAAISVSRACPTSATVYGPYFGVVNVRVLTFHWMLTSISPSAHRICGHCNASSSLGRMPVKHAVSSHVANDGGVSCRALSISDHIASSLGGWR